MAKNAEKETALYEAVFRLLARGAVKIQGSC